MVTEVTDETFEEMVLNADKLVVVDFWAPWCGPCVRLGPILEKIASEFPEFTVLKYNMDEGTKYSWDYLSQMDSQGIPTVVLYDAGEPVGSFIGCLPEDDVRELFTEWTEKYVE